MREATHSTFQPSPWPLPAGGRRVLISADQVQQMQDDRRSSSLHPHGFGFYPQALGHQMSRQEHADDLVIYCVEGRGHCEVAGRRHPVQAGDWLVLAAGQPHQYHASARSPWSIFWMHLGGVAVTDWLAPFTARGPVTPVGLHERLIQDFRALLDSTAAGYRHDNLLLAASLCQQLLAAAQVYAQREQGDTGDQISRLHAYMDTHLEERLNLGHLVAASGAASRFQFIRNYKQQTGQTPMQAFMHRKMAHACYLLEVSDTPVADIGRRLGFDDPYYFSRAFKRVVGVSPARYRERGYRH